MAPRVTVVLVARTGAEFLERTLAALARQTRKPDAVIAVDAGSRDNSRELLAASAPTQLVDVPGAISFSAAVTRALQAVASVGVRSRPDPVAASGPTEAAGLEHETAPELRSPAAELVSVLAADTVTADQPPAAGPATGRALAGQPYRSPEQPPDPADEWLWLLAHDSAPEPTALAELLAAVEIAPSVAVAGPKIMRWQQPDVLADFGQTLTRLGATVQLVEGELDQGQHDVRADVLGVAATGMLVRRSLWNALRGFDPALPGLDSGLDFSLRARLAGHRVILVPAARIAAAQGPAAFGRARASEARRRRLARTAQLHRRLVYAPLWALAFHWLSLVPLAVLRALGHLLTKRPGAIGGEFRAAFRAAFTGRVAAARRNFHRTKVLGWASVAALRMSWPAVRERRAQEREAYQQSLLHAHEQLADEEHASFLGDGGFWVTVATAAVGIILFGRLLGAPALAGGSLAPLSGHLADLWAHTWYGWHDIGGGFVGAADPFVFVLALLGSLTFWAPSFGIVLFYAAALPLAALGAWFCARRLSRRAWLPVIAAVLWAFAPPFLGSLVTGRLGASIAQVLLPWLVLALVNATRSWAAAATAGLLFAAVTASAPSLAPPLLVLWLIWLFAQPKSAHRIVGIPIPALALFAPLIVQQFLRGNPLALLADPGVPVAGATSSGWRLALADAGLGTAPGALHGWSHALALPGLAAPAVVAALLLPIGALALLALFVPGSRRAIPALVVALLGYLSAVALSRVEVSFAGSAAIPVWPGAALGLFWLGLLGAALVGLDALGRYAGAAALVSALAAFVLVVPLLGTIVSGNGSVRAGTGRMLPALTTAQAQVRPSVGTLLITPVGTGISTALARGAGDTLDQQSTLAATDTALTATQRRVATLAGNLVSRSGYDAKSDLRALDIGYVVLTDARGGDDLHSRATSALDDNALLSQIGQTPDGMLWQFADLPAHPATLRPHDTGQRLGLGILVAQGGIFGATLLLGIPTARRRKRRAAVSGSRERPLDELSEDDDG